MQEGHCLFACGVHSKRLIQNVSPRSVVKCRSFRLKGQKNTAQTIKISPLVGWPYCAKVTHHIGHALRPKTLSIVLRWCLTANRHLRAFYCEFINLHWGNRIVGRRRRPRSDTGPTLLRRRSRLTQHWHRFRLQSSVGLFFNTVSWFGLVMAVNNKSGPHLSKTPVIDSMYLYCVFGLRIMNTIVSLNRWLLKLDC